MNRTPITPALVLAYVLLGKMITAARNAGDVGRVFIATGVRNLLSREIEVRRECAVGAEQIATEAHTVDQMIADALTDTATPGEIDPTEAACIRSHARKAERHAAQLAEQLRVQSAADEPAPFFCPSK